MSHDDRQGTHGWKPAAVAAVIGILVIIAIVCAYFEILRAAAFVIGQ